MERHFCWKNWFQNLKKKIFNCKKEALFLSSVTIAELEYGVSKSQFREKNRHALLDFCSDFTNIIDFTTEDTETYGMIRAYLENKGMPIGPFDTQIAAQGLARNLTVVTNNIREFSRIPGLKVEDWTKE